MLDDFRRSAVGFWEKRRLIYNLLLIPPAWLAWNLSADFSYSIDDRIPARIDDPYVIRSALYLLLMANVCYSMAYVLEVFLMSEKKRAWWPKGGRLVVFCTGCLIGILFASSSAFHLQTAARGPWRESEPEKTGANQSRQPTSIAVTFRADARPAPAMLVAAQLSMGE